MAKCKFCGAEVTIGERCTYCGSKAEGWYYSGEEKKQEPKKKKAPHNRVRDLFNGMDAGVHSVIMSHIEEHSKKPAETRDRIVKLMAGGGLPKIELFARQSIDGWDCWGNEV